MSDNKRKFDDQGGATSPSPVAARRPTGFSAPIISPSVASVASPSYNSVPTPPDGIELAKQRAQEIAARIFSDAEAKRPRVENGSSADDLSHKGFGSEQLLKPLGQSIALQLGTTIPSLPSYGYPGSSKKIDIPNGRVGVIIGKSGETIKYLQVQSGARIQVTRDMDADPNSQTRPVEIIGTPEQISKAEQLINDVLSEAEAGGSGLAAARKFTSVPTGSEHFSMKVLNNKVGLIIGKGGETIKNMQASSGARIQVIPLHLPPGDTSIERTVHIDGTKEQIELAKQLVSDVTSENRARNPQTAGGYHPPRPPTSWAPSGASPMQQTGYGYMQPGAYPGPPPQYSMSQPPYGGYPPPAQSGWDQSSNSTTQQSTQQGTGYDYYNQTQPQQQQQQQSVGVSSAPMDGNSYNYNQVTPTYNGQGQYGESAYSQSAAGHQPSYGASGYNQASQTGYVQPVSNPQAAYAPQVYNSTSAYGNVATSTQAGSNPNYGVQGSTQQTPGQASATQQGYTAQQPSAAAQPGYVMPPTSQPGYGSQSSVQADYSQSASSGQTGYVQPHGQKPPPSQAYGQGLQPQTSQAGYAQPAQYSHSAQAYSQPPTAPSGYAQGGVPQAAYGQQQAYADASQSQSTGYGQQQQQSYGDYSAGAYSQPPYSSDGTHGSYDVASAAPAATGGVTKASPQS